jgi:23S rRNA (cytosine1962-C5)-methyltransferase
MPTLLQPRTAQQKPIHLQLANRTLIKTIKSGHPWLYADSLQSLPPAPSGSLALIKTKEGDIIAKVGDDQQQQLSCCAP